MPSKKNQAQSGVFVLHHVHLKPDGEEDVKLIGVYSTRRRAAGAAKTLCKQPGFKESPGGFQIDTYTLNETEWQEGFVTIMHG